MMGMMDGKNHQAIRVWLLFMLLVIVVVPQKVLVCNEKKEMRTDHVFFFLDCELVVFSLIFSQAH